MPRIWLVRHGRASAGWNTDPDPGLDALGQAQACAIADLFAGREPVRMVSSPLVRCQQTAAPLAERWGATVLIEPAVAEIPSPIGVAMADRTDWLRAAMAGTWAALGERYTNFRDGVTAFVRSQTQDTVIFSHFVAINAVIGAVLNDDRLVIRSLDNCSVTTIDVWSTESDGSYDEAMTLVSGGHEADTLIR